MIDAATKRARDTVRKRAAELGATVNEDNNGKTYSVAIEAPAGHRWSGDEVHEMHDSTNVGPWSYAEVWARLEDRMSYGVERCGPDCEWCDS